MAPADWADAGTGAAVVAANAMAATAATVPVETLKRMILPCFEVVRPRRADPKPERETTGSERGGA